MAVHVPNHFPIRHINRLPRPLVRGLATAVLFMHGILIAAALRSIPLVELGGSAGGGNGGGNGSGNKALFVSVLQNNPSLSGTSAERQMVRSAEKPASMKKKKQPELIATTAATQKTSPENQTIRKTPVKQVPPLRLNQKRSLIPGFFPPGQRIPVRSQTPPATPVQATAREAVMATEKGQVRDKAKGKEPVTASDPVVPETESPVRCHFPSSATNGLSNPTTRSVPSRSMNRARSMFVSLSIRQAVSMTPGLSFPPDSVAWTKRL